MLTVEILKGLPASSKTTYAKNKVKKNKSMYKRVNKDDLRAMLDDSQWSNNNEKFILELRDKIIVKSLDDGKHVIVDDTNLHPKHEERIRQVISNWQLLLHVKRQVKIVIKMFDISPEEAIIRDLKRPNSVGSKIIMDMYNKFIKEEEKIEPIKQDPSLPHAIICDLDGTLCINEGTRGHYEYDKCDTDLVNKSVENILLMWINETSPLNEIIFLSGREDSCKDKTIKWLHDKCGIIPHQLYMRKTGDYRKDYTIKKEIFDEKIKNKYYIEFILDDRNQVVDMWRKMGLDCLQVAEGDF